MKLIWLIIISTTLSAAAQLTLKTGLNEYGTINNLLNVLFQPLIITGLTLYVISATSWILVLSKAEISYAYPLGAISYAIVAILGFTLMNETINELRIAGITVILIGVYMVGKS